MLYLKCIHTILEMMSHFEPETLKEFLLPVLKERTAWKQSQTLLLLRKSLIQMYPRRFHEEGEVPGSTTVSQILPMPNLKIEMIRTITIIGKILELMSGKDYR